MGTTQPDRDTKSVLDIVEKNYEAVGLKTFATRMIYIGEHSLPKQELIEHFTEVINTVNSGYCDIHLYGILLVYDGYFVHILEGSEDSLHRHIRFIFNDEQEWIKKMERLDLEALEEEEDEVGLKVIMAEGPPPQPIQRQIYKRMKIIMIYDCIKNLIFKEWRALTARPPSLIGRLDVYGPLQEHIEQLRICLNKITKLIALADGDRHLSFEGLSAVDPKMEALPEVALLEFLLQSQYMLDLRATAALHRRVDDYRFYFEEVWPLPTHFTPRQLYKLKIDDTFVEALPVMPWEKVTKQKEGEEDDFNRSNLSINADNDTDSSSG